MAYVSGDIAGKLCVLGVLNSKEAMLPNDSSRVSCYISTCGANAPRRRVVY